MDYGMATLLYPLHAVELVIYFSIWIAHSFAAFFVAIRSSYKVGKWLNHWLEDSWYFNGMRMDNSDIEWKLFRMSFPVTLLILFLHSATFQAIKRLNVDRRSQFRILIFFWFILHIIWSSLQCVLSITAFTIILIFVTSITRNQKFCWILAIVFIQKISDIAPFSHDPTRYYREFNLYLYSAIKVVNICIYLVKNEKQPVDRNLFSEFMLYMLYPPFSMALIVLFEDFRKQFATAIENQENLLDRLNIAKFLKLFARILFWFFSLEFLLHLCCVNAIFNSPFTMLKTFNNYEIAAIAYVAGQLFHLKYVVIFGLLSLFASLDGMVPQKPPICISRVSNYSQMWRHFDVGLHKFLRNQVYIPLLTLPIPYTNVAMRKLFAMVSVFLFVLTWHGVNSNYFWWVCLSGFSLCIERLGTELISSCSFIQKYILTRLSAANFIRIKAMFMLTTVITGIFGIFFFLSRAGVGDYIFSNVLIEGLVQICTLNVHYLNSGWVLLHLFLMGYAFNHVCLFLEHRNRCLESKKSA